MDKINSLLYSQADQYGMCDEIMEQWVSNMTKPELLSFFKLQAIPCLKRDFPHIETLREHFCDEETRNNGLYVDCPDLDIDIDQLNYVFVNCKGRVRVNFTAKHLPLIYVSGDSEITFEGNIPIATSIYYFGEDAKIHTRNSDKFKIKKINGINK